MNRHHASFGAWSTGDITGSPENLWWPPLGFRYFPRNEQTHPSLPSEKVLAFPSCLHCSCSTKNEIKAAIETEETSGTTLLHPFSSSSLAFSSFTQKLENRKIFLTLPLIYVYSVLCSHKAIRFTSNWFRQLSKKDKKWRRRESLYYTSVMASTLYMLQTKLTGANLNANTDVLYSSNIHGMLCL